MNHDMATQGKYRAWETRRQNEERVAVNLPAHLRPLFDVIKGRYAGDVGTSDQRAVALVEYAEEHPGEVVDAIQDEADETLEAMIREYQGRAA